LVERTRSPGVGSAAGAGEVVGVLTDEPDCEVSEGAVAATGAAADAVSGAADGVVAGKTVDSDTETGFVSAATVEAGRRERRRPV
jgi:hypothetical protein